MGRKSKGRSLPALTQSNIDPPPLAYGQKVPQAHILSAGRDHHVRDTGEGSEGWNKGDSDIGLATEMETRDLNWSAETELP